MSRSRFRVILLLLVAALLLQGCTYFKLVRPEPRIVSIDSIRTFRSNTAKFAYSPQGLSSELIEKALRDSLTAYGIHDVIKSDKLEQDRINMIAYTLGIKPRYSDFYIKFPWALISIGTLMLVPYYEENIQLVEIHVIIPSRDYDRQLKIIRTEYAIAQWTWLPFLFMSNNETREDVHYGVWVNKLNYLGWRRIFDGVVMDLMKD